MVFKALKKWQQTVLGFTIPVLLEVIFNLCNQPYPRIKLGKRKNTIFEEYECNVLEGSY